MGLQAFNSIPDAKYYLREHSDPSPEFRGKLAVLLGVRGEFSEAMFLRLFNGKNPHNGDKLPGIRIATNHVGAWDMTFNQEKWLSVLELVAGDSRIGDIRRESITKAMEYMESEIRVAVRKQSQMDAPKIKGWKYPERISGNGLWEVFNHFPSREGDPNGHGHAVFHNMSFDPVEKQLKAAVTRFVSIPTMERIYHEHFTKKLNNLGYDVKLEGKRMVLKDFPKDVSDEFSKGHQRIKDTETAMEAKIGKEMSPKAKGKLSLYNRPEKEFIPIDIRRRGWLSRISDSQLTNLHGFVKRAKATVARLKIRASFQKLKPVEVEHDRGIER